MRFVIAGCPVSIRPLDSRSAGSLFCHPRISRTGTFLQHPKLSIDSPFFAYLAMLSRRVVLASRSLKAFAAPRSRYAFPVVHQFRSYADKVIKVPEMAESISEGTLKQWSKQVGDYVEQDEEIATIETDKVCIAG